MTHLCPRCASKMIDISRKLDGMLWKCQQCGWQESIRDLAGTPDVLFSKLDREFKFGLDVCATPENSKVKNGLIPCITPKMDGLFCSWKRVEWNWCNPPYSNIDPWVEKAIREAREGANSVLLLPNDTSTKWFRRCYDCASEIRFLVGPRIQFVPPKGLKYSTNTGTNIVVVFRAGNRITPAALVGWEWMR